MNESSFQPPTASGLLPDMRKLSVDFLCRLQAEPVWCELKMSGAITRQACRPCFIEGTGEFLRKKEI